MPERPFTTFNFKVRLHLGDEPNPICDGAFSEVTGLELSMDAHVIREGGNNARQIRLVGPVSYGQLTLKRGMAKNADLWRWFRQVQSNRSLRASGEVVMLAEDGATENAKFALTGCLPLKLRVPSFNAQNGLIAIEEMQIGYETLDLST